MSPGCGSLALGAEDEDVVVLGQGSLSPLQLDDGHGVVHQQLQQLAT